MLKGISPLLTPELLKILAEMGHGDELVIGDINFPAQSMGQRCVRCDGKGGVESLTKFKIDIAFANDFEDDFGSSFGFESLDNSMTDDKVEKTDEEIPKEADNTVSSEKENET